MKKKIVAIALGACCLMCISCSVLQGVASQLQGIANLANCEYTMTNVNNVSVAGVNLKKISNGNVSAADVLTLSAALLQKSLPLSMDVNVKVKNPTDYDAKLATMDWALDIENQQIAAGLVNQNRTIGAKKSSTVPLAVGTDLYGLFSKNGIESVKKFAGSFNNDGTSSKVALRIRPHVRVANIDMPTSYITLSKNVGVTPKGNATVKK
ncbi:MAG: hypothetical protein AUK63_1375 [bacterium P3]|nr:MAG: hypothetical protein AUK63_1375 [bacterium P3]KWW40132.1 MAG: hypothetical protein F083_1854 [bacterium F083]